MISLNKLKVKSVCDAKREKAMFLSRKYLEIKTYFFIIYEIYIYIGT